MGFWRRLLGGTSDDELKPQRLDYLNEALALERQGDYEAALTSYRLALRDHPNDARILQNMAIAFTSGDPDGATQHLRAFLAHPPKGADADKWVAHATQALRDLGAGPGPAAAISAEGP